jgi:hypothetical protein
MLAKYIFFGGVLCVVPHFLALVTSAAADWQRWPIQRQAVSLQAFMIWCLKIDLARIAPRDF